MSESPILYIEDEEDYQILVRRMLQRAGLAVEMAGTGEEGLAALERHRPSMLLLDINLPDTDGYTLCNRLRQDSAWVDLPILMLTVRRRPEEWLRGFSSGANDYVCKPLDPTELIERVQNCLTGKAQQFANPGTPEYHLIQAAIAGNRAAFEVLIQKYKARLVESMRQLARGEEEAEDIVSHAFVTAFEKMDRFRGEASFYTWLYRIATNEAYQARPTNKIVSMDGMTRTEESALPAALAREDCLPEKLAGEEDRRRILASLKSVPQPYRQLLELFFIKDMPYEQIARKLDMPLGTVMSRLSKARDLLRENWNRKTLTEPSTPTAYR